MPPLDGIEFTGLMKKDPQLKSIPILIVSYKDREEDPMRGFEAGADYYLTKGKIHDETLLQAIADLIGESEDMRIAIVNDVPLGRRSSRGWSSAPHHEIAWVAHDGPEAVDSAPATGRASS